VAGQVNSVLTLVYVLLALTVVVSLLGLVNTLALAVHERRRELGLLRAVRAERAQVRQVVRYESVVTALIGAVSGSPSVSLPPSFWDGRSAAPASSRPSRWARWPSSWCSPVSPAWRRRRCLPAGRFALKCWRRSRLLSCERRPPAPAPRPGSGPERLRSAPLRGGSTRVG
jgi:hypothetical protein